jgi:tetratricopeptide (TPR) repeat protein
VKQKRVLKTAPPATANSPLWPRLWPYLLLAALAFGIYANALGNGFVSDDRYQLAGNPLIADWRKLPEIFQHDVWAFTGGGASNYYRPLQATVYLLLYSLGGFDAFLFHLAMVLLHAANTLLVYALCLSLAKSRYAALAAGALFAVHPIHSEAVLWVAAMPDMLLTAFALSALLWFVRSDAAPGPRQIAGLSGLYMLALLSKEPGAMLAPLLAGYEFFYLGRPLRETLRRNWRIYISLAGVFGVYLLLRAHALGGLGLANNHNHLSGPTLFWSVGDALRQYLLQLIAPVHLNYYHFFEPASFTLLTAVSLAFELAIIAAIFLLRPSLASYSLFFILMPLAPALNLNAVGANVVAERYLYLPSVGFVLLLALGWEWLAARQRTAAWAATAVALVASAWILLPRNLEWHDEERLLLATAASSPKAVAMLSDLGTYYYSQGQFDSAIAKYQAAVQLQPENAELHHNLGNAYERKGSYAEAAAELRKAIGLKPAYAEAHMSLGLALYEAGDLAGAGAEEQKALEIRPGYPEACDNLAMVRIQQKQFDAAIDLLHRALALNPKYFEAQFNLGAAYNYSDRYPEAVEALKKAIAMAPDQPNLYLAHYHLGTAYARMGSSAKAAEEFSAALQLRPDFTPARDALAQAQK